MFTYKTRTLLGGSNSSTLFIFNQPVFTQFKGNNVGWFRLFGIGLTYAHNSITPIFSERIGKKKKIHIGGYRFGFLK